MTQALLCPNCNAPLDYDGGRDPTVRCAYCGTVVIVPESLRDQGEPRAESVTTVEAEVRQLLQAGDKIEAIKCYREAFGVGLKEAKDAVERLDQSGLFVVPDLSEEIAASDMQTALEQADVVAEIVHLAKGGEKAEAVHLFRETFDVSYTQAKGIVDQLVQGQDLETARATVYSSSHRKSDQSAMVKQASVVAGGVSCFSVGLIIFIALVVLTAVLIPMTMPGGPLAGVWTRINPTAFARLVDSFGGEGTGPGRFMDSRHIAVDSDGNMYIGDYSDGRIQLFDTSGEFISLWMVGTEVYLIGMDASRDGVVYVAHSGEIWIYDGASGELFGKLEFDGDHYFEDVAVAADGGLVTVSRGDNLHIFDANRRLALTIPEAITSVSGDSELDTHVAVDGLGYIYALGTFNSAVFKFGPDGNYITRFGSAGEEPGQLRAPQAIAVDRYGRVYVSDINGIQIFDPDGRYLDRFSVEGVAFGLAFDDLNRLLVVTSTSKAFIYEVQEPKE